MERLPITVWQVCEEADALRLHDVVDDARTCRPGELLARIESGFHLPDLLVIHRWDERIAARTRLFARVYLDPRANDAGEVVLDAHADATAMREQFESAIGIASARSLRASLPARRKSAKVVSLHQEAPELGDFELHYQPQWAISGADIVGAEALLRWHGLAVPGLKPEALVADAEARGQITQLGDWIAERAAWQLSHWLAHWPQGARLSLNLSPAQLDDAGFPERLARSLARLEVAPSQFELEVACEAVATLSRRQIETVQALAGLGMTIALDRLGATAISRESLERLPARTWKLHRGLVARTAGHRDAALLVESLTALAHDMRVRTVAVGVESTEQQALAARLGCDAIQGFLRAEALPPAQFEALLIAHLERHGPRRGARG